MKPSVDLSALVRDYGDPVEEALACRRDCALFDFSFVRCVRLAGSRACTALEAFCARPLADLPSGRIRYALNRDAGGHLVSDLTIWRMGAEHWEVMTGNPADLAVVQSLPGAAPAVEERAIFAVQGPRTLEALAPLVDLSALTALRAFAHTRAEVAGIDCLVGRLGYTGEAGVEVLCAASEGPALWRRLAACARPAGFAAADVLRIEAGLALFCNEFALPVTPAEAGLAGFAPLAGNRAAGIERLCMAAEGQGPVLWQPPRPLGRPQASGEVVVTSACQSPIAGGCLLMGYARREDLAEGRPLVDPSGTFGGLRRVGLPLHDPGRLRPGSGWTHGGS